MTLLFYDIELRVTLCQTDWEIVCGTLRTQQNKLVTFATCFFYNRNMSVIFLLKLQIDTQCQ